MSPVGSRPLDGAALAQVRSLFGDDPAALAKFIAEHLATSERLLDEIGRELARTLDAAPAGTAELGERRAPLRRALHSLVGCTGFFGEKTLMRRIEAFAAALREDRRGELSSLFAALRVEYRGVRAALLALAGSPPA